MEEYCFHLQDFSEVSVKRGDSLLYANRNTKEETQNQKIVLISNQNINVAGGVRKCKPTLGQEKYGTQNVGWGGAITKLGKILSWDQHNYVTRRT